MCAPESRIMAVDAADPRAVRALTAYAVEVRAAAGLDVLDAQAAVTDVRGFAPPRGFFLLAVRSGEPVACLGLRPLGETDGEIKRMWVHPDLRGTGLAAQLLSVAEAKASDIGYVRLLLDTNTALLAARRFYAAHGYAEIARYNDNPDATHFFAKELTSPA